MLENCFDCPFLSRYFKRNFSLYYKCSGEHFTKKRININSKKFIEPPDTCPYKHKATD